MFTQNGCGSYILGKGGTLNIGRLILLRTDSVIKRIDAWDEGITSLFKLKLRAKYSKINSNMVKSQTVELNYYGGSNYVIHVHTYNEIVESYSIGPEPEINYTEMVVFNKAIN